jgi:hypothetical protein
MEEYDAKLRMALRRCKNIRFQDSNWFVDASIRRTNANGYIGMPKEPKAVLIRIERAETKEQYNPILDSRFTDYYFVIIKSEKTGYTHTYKHCNLTIKTPSNGKAGGETYYSPILYNVLAEIREGMALDTNSLEVETKEDLFKFMYFQKMINECFGNDFDFNALLPDVEDMSYRGTEEYKY